MAAVCVPRHLDDGEWYHGSPAEIRVLAEGSTITRCRAVAEAFSHRPTWVRMEESEQGVSVSHDGELPGRLYAVDEPVTEQDLHPHPNSSYRPGGLEWITNRPLRLRLIAESPPPGGNQ